MAKRKYFIDDNVVIPEEYKKMSLEEIEAELSKLIAEDIANGKASPNRKLSPNKTNY